LSLSEPYMFILMPICFWLLEQTIFLPCSLTFCKAGISIAINIAIMEITTNSSINVNPCRLGMAYPVYV